MIVYEWFIEWWLSLELRHELLLMSAIEIKILLFIIIDFPLNFEKC